MYYTYTKLIQGARFSYNYHTMQFTQARKAKKVEETLYHAGWMNYYQDEIRRYKLCRLVCGDDMVLVN